MNRDQIMENIEYARNSIKQNETNTLTDIQINVLKGVISASVAYVFENPEPIGGGYNEKIMSILEELNTHVSKLIKTTDK